MTALRRPLRRIAALAFAAALCIPLIANAQQLSSAERSPAPDAPVPLYLPTELTPPPDSTQVITAAMVKNYWLELLKMPSPPGTGVAGYREAYAAYAERAALIKDLIGSVHRGYFDAEAEILAMRHNLFAFRKRGMARSAEQVAGELAAAEAKYLRQSDANRIAALEAEVAALRAEVARLSGRHGAAPAEAEPPAIGEPVPSPERTDRREIYDYGYGYGTGYYSGGQTYIVPAPSRRYETDCPPESGVGRSPSHSGRGTSSGLARTSSAANTIRSVPSIQPGQPVRGYQMQGGLITHYGDRDGFQTVRPGAAQIQPTVVPAPNVPPIRARVPPQVPAPTRTGGGR